MSVHLNRCRLTMLVLLIDFCRYCTAEIVQLSCHQTMSLCLLLALSQPIFHIMPLKMIKSWLYIQTQSCTLHFEKGDIGANFGRNQILTNSLSSSEASYSFPLCVHFPAKKRERRSINNTTCSRFARSVCHVYSNCCSLL